MQFGYDLTNISTQRVDFVINDQTMHLPPQGTVRVVKTGPFRANKSFAKKIIKLIREKVLSVRRVRFNPNAVWMITCMETGLPIS